MMQVIFKSTSREKNEAPLYRTVTSRSSVLLPLLDYSDFDTLRFGIRLSDEAVPHNLNISFVDSID